MGEIGYAVANVSERELAIGYEGFLAQKKDAAFPLVSANLVFQSNGKPIVEPYIVIKLDPKKYPALKTPLRVAIAGVTRFNPVFLKSAPPKDNVVIASPVDELKKYIPEMRKKADQIIVLAAMPRDDAHLLVKQVPGIDLVVAGFLAFSTAVEEKEGTTPIFFCGNQGKYLGEIRMLQSGEQTAMNSTLHYLNATYPSDPTVQAKVDAALAEINKRNQVAAQNTAPAVGSIAATEPTPAESRVFLTSAACKDCHGTEYTIWESSKHAHAMQTLTDKKSDFTPECVGCHVLAYKKKDGFVDLKTTPAFANVQCESCHGAGMRHVKNPQAPYGKTGPLACLQCHTRENSPGFEFATYWAKIRHGV